MPIARGRLLPCAASVSLALQPALAFALPEGGVVNGGQATISQAAGAVEVSQASHRAIIDWQTFDVGAAERVHFSQPDASAIALNRIHDVKASAIDGMLSANGQVWLVNPHGILFGAGARVNVAGLLATTADISNDRFMSGEYRFDIPGDAAGVVENAGTITVEALGLAALVAPGVKNSGTITARLGKVQIGSADTFALDLYGDGLISLALSERSSTFIAQAGLISAEGGTVTLTAAAAQDAIDSLINVSGDIDVSSVNDHAGRILIYAEGSNAVEGNVTADKGQKAGSSTVLVSGALNAGGTIAGEISVLGDRVGILSGARIDASGLSGGGTIKIGGDYQGQGVTPTAKRTIVQGNANIFANALASGEGGRVIVWADERTDFAGTIEAKGGALGGNGGFVETSGKRILSAAGLVDASAPAGNAGTWLLDPNNVTIQSAGSDTNVTGSPNFTTTDDSAIVTTGSIQAALNAGTSVTVTTASQGSNSQPGNITVASSITKSAGGDASLTLKAHENITVNAAISSSSNKLNVILNADSDANSSGYINMAANITSNGGNITMGGGADPTTGYAFGNGTQSQGVLLSGGTTINAGGGNISIRGRGNSGTANAQYGVWTGSNVQTAGTGAIAITGVGNGSGGSTSDTGVNITSGTISAVDGDVTVTGSTLWSAHGVQILNAGTAVKTTGAGAVNLTGTGLGGYGVYVAAADGVQATGGGAINITGDGSSVGVYITGSVTGGGGAVTITGAPSGSGNVQHGVHLNGGSVTNTGSGTISITGTGAGGGGNFNHGIYISTSGSVSSTGSGAITLTGTAGAGSAFAYDIATSTGTNTVGGASATGEITLNANTLSLANYAGQTTGNFWFKPRSTGATVGIAGGSGTLQVTSAILGATTAGTISVGRTDGTGAMNANAYASWASHVNLYTGSGLMTIAGAQALGARNLLLQTDSDLTLSAALSGTSTLTVKPSTASTTMSLNGGAGTLALSTTELNYLTAGWTSLNFGRSDGSGLMRVGNYNWADNVSFLNGSANIQFDGGTSTLTSGKYLTATTTSGDILSNAAGSIVTSGTGTITLASGNDLNFAHDFDLTTATGAVTLRANNSTLYTASGDITTSGGHVVLNSDRDASGAGTILLGTGTAIGTGGGNITLGGGADPTTTAARGTSVNGYQTGVMISNGASVNAGGGNIVIIGQGGTSASGNNNGVQIGQPYVAGAAVQATGTGTITITGQNGTGGSSNKGVLIAGSGVGVQAAGGSITITGTGDLTGVNLLEGSVTNTTGSVTINATGFVYGFVSYYGAATTTTGDLTINSNYLYLDNGASVRSSGGNILFNNSGGYAAGNIVTIGGVGNTGGVTFQSNDFYLGSTSALTGGNVTIRPYTASRTIGINGATGSLAISATTLGTISASTLTIGRSDGSGLMRVAGYDASARNWNLSLLNGSGNIQFDGGGTALTLAANKSFSTAATSGSFTTSATGTITTSGTGAITIDDPVSLGGNLTLNSAGTLTFGSTVNGGYNLTGSAGTFSFASALGASTPLSAVSLTSTNGMTLPSITAASILARTTGASSDLTIAGGSTLTASGSNTALTLVSGRNFINSSGSGALVTPSGRWLVYSADPASDTIGSLANDFRRFSCAYGGSCPSFPGTGNGLLYSSTPTLTATPNGISITYGDTAPSLAGYAYTLSGYLGSDSGGDSVTGSLTGGTTYAQGSNAGSYNVSYGSGTLASALGYGFSYANNATAITVGKKALTATVQDQGITYGTNTPILSKSNTGHVTYTGLYGSDTGADLDTVSFSYGGATAGGVNNAGSYTLSLSAFTDNNYSLTLPGGVTSGTLTINPAPLTITAEDTTRSQGQPNPEFTAAYAGFVNGDTFSVLSGLSFLTAALASSPAGEYDITPFGAVAANYAISYIDGTLTVTAPLTIITDSLRPSFRYDETPAERGRHPAEGEAARKKKKGLKLVFKQPAINLKAGRTGRSLDEPSALAARPL